MKKLIVDVLIKITAGILLTGALTFIPAGTLHFWQGWVLIGTLFIPMFTAAFVVAGLNFRYGWMQMPPALTWITAAIFLAGYVMYAEVMRENTYLCSCPYL